MSFNSPIELENTREHLLVRPVTEMHVEVLLGLTRPRSTPPNLVERCVEQQETEKVG
jgi:hypothetical protein